MTKHHFFLSFLGQAKELSAPAHMIWLPEQIFGRVFQICCRWFVGPTQEGACSFTMNAKGSLAADRNSVLTELPLSFSFFLIWLPARFLFFCVNLFAIDSYWIYRRWGSSPNKSFCFFGSTLILNQPETSSLNRKVCPIVVFDLPQYLRSAIFLIPQIYFESFSRVKLLRKSENGVIVVCSLPQYLSFTILLYMVSYTVLWNFLSANSSYG